MHSRRGKTAGIECHSHGNAFEQCGAERGHLPFVLLMTHSPRAGPRRGLSLRGKTLHTGARAFPGPAILADRHGNDAWSSKRWEARVVPGGGCASKLGASFSLPEQRRLRDSGVYPQVDPSHVGEVVQQYIQEHRRHQMGLRLHKTALSVNIQGALDCSCR